MTFMPIHVAAGAIAIIAGFVALYALKGAWLHRKAGIMFVYVMLLVASSGAAMAALKAQRFNVAQGVLTVYLVTTALLTVRRRVASVHWIHGVAILVAVMVGIYEIMLGLEALGRPRGTIDGAPAAMVFIFAAVALLAAVGDLRMVARDIQGRARITRHLWRMCVATFIATGSFFLGPGNKVIPEQIRFIPVLAILALLPLGVMIYWLLRGFLMRRSSRPDPAIQL
jgi:hypothetical protein